MVTKTNRVWHYLNNTVQNEGSSYVPMRISMIEKISNLIFVDESPFIEQFGKTKKIFIFSKIN